MNKKRIPDTPDRQFERDLLGLRTSVRKYDVTHNTVRMARLGARLAEKTMRGVIGNDIEIKRRSIPEGLARLLKIIDDGFVELPDLKRTISFTECVLGGTLLSATVGRNFHLEFERCVFTESFRLDFYESASDSEAYLHDCIFLEGLTISGGKGGRVHLLHNIVKDTTRIEGIECDRIDLTLNDFGDRVSISRASFARQSKIRSNRFQGPLYIDDVIFQQAPDFQWSVFGGPVYCDSVAGWDLRRTRGFEFDGHISRNAALDPETKVGWSTLRRLYSGPRLIVNLALLVLFFAKHAGLLLVWAAAAAAADLIFRLLSESGVEARLPPIEEVAVWEAVIGRHLPRYEVVATIIVILCTVIRSVLTIQVASLRDHEIQTGRSPYRWRTPREPKKTSILKSWLAFCRLAAIEYGPLIWTHYVFRWIFVASTIYVVLSIGRAFFISIPLLHQ